MQEEYRKLSLWMTYSVSKNSKSLEEKVIVIRENLRSKVLNRRSILLNGDFPNDKNMLIVQEILFPLEEDIIRFIVVIPIFGSIGPI